MWFVSLLCVCVSRVPATLSRMNVFHPTTFPFATLPRVYQRGIQTCLYDGKCLQLFEALALFQQSRKDFAGAGACLIYPLVSPLPLSPLRA